jgi:hypothetical protein
MKNITESETAVKSRSRRGKALFLSALMPLILLPPFMLAACDQSTSGPATTQQPDDETPETPVQKEYKIHPIAGGEVWTVENKTGEPLDEYIEDITSSITTIHNELSNVFPIQNITDVKIIIEDAPSYDGKNFRIDSANTWAIRLALLEEKDFAKLRQTFGTLFNTLKHNGQLVLLNKQPDNSKRTVRLS